MGYLSLNLNRNMVKITKQPTSDSARYPIYTAEQAFTHLIQKRSAELQELYIETDKILFNVWDALCLSITDKYNEDYLPFLPHVFELLVQTSDGQDISDYLLYVEEKQFGAAPLDTLALRRAARTVDILLEMKNDILK